MANIKKIRQENVAGNFFVDETCIDCGTCYWMAPFSFRRAGEQSNVYLQPRDGTEIKRCYEALLSCPTNSIGIKKISPELKTVDSYFPKEIEGGVFHTGFHSEKSFGATSYFIQNSRGNILIDSPRYLPKLSKVLKLMGGIKFQYLTHRDDVADTDKYWEKFNSMRVIHRDDAGGQYAHFEKLIEGDDPYFLWEDNSEAVIIPVPGHTKGHTVLLYKDKFLFTGDHLAWSHSLNQLVAFKRACWFDFKAQIKSMEKLLDFQFEYILPGHGAPFYAPKDLMKNELEKCIKWMRE